MAHESIESNFTSMHPTVEFLDILDSYPFDTDLACKFKFNDYIPQEGDRIAIYKIGWSLVKDYMVFLWTPTIIKDHQGSISFNRNTLPKNSIEVYQFCYINRDNELHGASTPFQFFSGVNLMSVSGMSVSIPTNSMDYIKKSQTFLESQKDQEICRLNEENAMLRDTLKAMLYQNKVASTKNYDKEIGELKELTEGLNVMLVQHQKDIDMLKSKIIEGGEEYKKNFILKS